jgi:hypothetical protein
MTNGLMSFMNHALWKIIVVIMILLLESSAFAEGPSAWLNINYTGTEHFENGEKTVSSTNLFQNYYFSFNKSINPVLSYNFYLRTSLMDSHTTDSKGNKTSSYQRAAEPAIDVSFRNPMYSLDAGYRRLEQWPTEHIKDFSRNTTEFYYSRFNLTTFQFPSLSLQFDRQMNYDHLSIKKLDNTTTVYTANSMYNLSYKDLHLSYNLSYTRNENETPLSEVIWKTIDSSLNVSYNIAYNKSFWDNRVSFSAGYQGNYVHSKNEQFVNQTGEVPFKRTSLGMYGLGTQIEPNVDTLASATTLTDSIYNVAATTSAGTINIGQNGKKFHNIGIELFSSEQPVDTLYIYVNKDITSDTNLGNTINWAVYKSGFNQPGTWTPVNILSVNMYAYDPLNNIYRYEIKFSAPQKDALFFRAINLEIATVSDVLVTEIEAFGTEVVSSSGKITGTSTFFTQGINLNTNLRPIDSLTFSLNYFLNRADQHPKSIIDSIKGAFSNLLSKSTTGYKEELRSNISRTYGANVTWLAHRLLTATANFQRNEAFDNQYETAFHSDAYSLNFSSSPLPTLDTSLSFNRTYSYSFNEKQSMNNLYMLTISSRLYKNVNMITDVGYTQTETYAMAQTSATPATENTKLSTQYINGTIDARLTPNLFTSLTYGFSQASGSTSSSSNNGSMIITYRPGRFINFTGTFRVSDTDGATSTAEGFLVDWLLLPVIRLNLNYQHTNTEPGSATTDTISSYAMWYITKFLYVQLTFSYRSNMNDVKNETYNFGGNLTCRFW